MHNTCAHYTIASVSLHLSSHISEKNIHNECMHKNSLAAKIVKHK